MSQVNVIEGFVIMLAFILTGACEAHFYKQLGVWGMLPSIGLGLVLAALVVATGVRTIRESVDAWRRKNGPTETP